ncbi:phytoene desaturase family protein [Pararhizobium mangrovi]|uniref:NAD(P)/FAD-dependent oxidoreductase n=1 Tax=Pararhizobium mangrovi TaxID=2590452 RepID=A0A506UEN9_9HYPH|nr:NAD(P)/FAD-dependent oxidoreductase [Pararhizobium mangrovi]TPW30207.1 NAD(P)/FAD-dependent oxidoreductase [Pararhizobium mangrovi]
MATTQSDGTGTTVDYIIVGSGINALTCAAILGKRGKSVLVLERENVAGGCMRSDEITVPGYRHDVMAATFVLFVTSPAYGILGEDLARHGLEFAHTGSPTAVVRPNGDHLVLTTDRTANRAHFEALAEGEGARYEAEIEKVERDAGLIFGLLGGALWTRKTARLLFGEVRKRGTRGLAARLGEGLRPARLWLENTFENELSRALFAPWVLHAGLGPEQAFSGEMARVIAFALEQAGAPVVRGGAGKIVSAFRALIEEQGGRILLEADVDKVRREAGKTRGVTLVDGRQFDARQGVVASVTPNQLHERLLAEPSAKTDAVSAESAPRSPASGYRYGKGNMQIHYALKRPPRWNGEGLSDVALVHLCAGIDAVSKAVNECDRGMLPERPTVCVGQPHALDPGRCPEGAGILWLQLPETPRFIKGDAAGTLETPADGTWSEPLREAYADRVEAILREHIADLDDIVIKRTVHSPKDLEAMNVNLVGGDPYGGACSIDQFFLWRPFTGSRNHETDVPGLYQIGASTHPGPGLGGGSGTMLAEHLTRSKRRIWPF